MTLSRDRLSCICYFMNSQSRLALRPATSDDLQAIAVLTQARRNELAAWEPWYWNPRHGVDETHPMYLGWCISDNPNCEVVIATENDHVVGCLFVNRRPQHDFLDDFCVVENRWMDVGQALVEADVVGARLICAPMKDEAQARWLRSTRYTKVSSFFSLRTPPPDQSYERVEPLEPLAFPDRLEDPPAHVFGDLDADTQHGLRVSTAHGYAIGSAPVTPPAYDPGGPTTVIDRVVGRNRRALVADVLETASRRHDVQVIFVVDHTDNELAEILTAAGATQPVHLWRLS